MAKTQGTARRIETAPDDFETGAPAASRDGARLARVSAPLEPDAVEDDTSRQEPLDRAGADKTPPGTKAPARAGTWMFVSGVCFFDTDNAGDPATAAQAFASAHTFFFLRERPFS